jgi:ATP synthase protein I
MTDSENHQTKPKHNEAPKPALNFLLMGAGSIFTSMLIAGFLVGYVLDQLFETTPLFLLGCAVLGFIGGLQKVHKLSSKLDPLPPAENKDDQKS